MALKLQREVDQDGFKKATGDYWRISNIVEVRPGNKKEREFIQFTMELWENKASRQIAGATPLKTFDITLDGFKFPATELMVEGINHYKYLYQWVKNNISDLSSAADD